MATVAGNARAKVRRRLPSIPYAASQRNSINIDRDGVLNHLAFALTFRCTNGATGPVGPLWQTLARLIRRLEIVINGQDTVVSISGAHLASRAQVENGVRAFGMASTVVLTNSAVTDYAVTIPLPLTLPRAVRPDDTSLDLRRVDQATIAITWGDATDLFTTPNAAAISNVNCDVIATYLVNAGPEESFLTRALDVQDIPNVSSNPNLTALMDRGSDLFWRSFHVAQLRGQVGVSNIVNEARLTAGSFTYNSTPAGALIAQTIADYAIPSAEFPAADWAFRIDMPTVGSNITLINGGALAGDLFANFSTTYTSGSEIISISREVLRPLRI